MPEEYIQWAYLLIVGELLLQKFIYFIQEHSTLQDSMAALEDCQLPLLLILSGDYTAWRCVDAKASVVPWNFFCQVLLRPVVGLKLKTGHGLDEQLTKIPV